MILLYMQKHVITNISTKDFPEELQRLHKPPATLHVLGNRELLTRKPRVGIVGARKFTPYGREVTLNVASELARAGVTVVSGLALGIDSIAHIACLDSRGKTIAVLPSGLKNVYPSSHAQLARRIVESGGLLVSEYADNFRPQRYTFLERNRIIAALSDILIIPEAAVASGSLNTANSALELGKTVMAVPGNITSSYSEGTNRLIRAGAEPLLQTEDVLNLLGMSSKASMEYLPENEAERALLDSIKMGITSVNDVIAASKLDTSTAQANLTLLEIKGIISVEGGYWHLR
jgi:DNA processing protein